MKTSLIPLALLCLSFSSVVHAADAPAYKPESGSKAETSKKPDWTFTPNPALPDVLILGDSISIAYTLQVRELLAGKANVYRPVSADGKNAVNCEGSTAGAQKLDGWLAGRKWSVIHFNWGLHDLKHVTKADRTKPSIDPADPVQATVDEYRRNMEVIVKKLQSTGAKLIFATTTPVTPGTTNPLREVDAPGRYNAAALEIMKASGIAVDDLFALSEPQLGIWQLPRNVHFKPEGSSALARQVATTIEAALPAKLPAP
jgi:lysophospholipase L1-like esterase